jgi:RNA recognition motif-containing protein
MMADNSSILSGAEENALSNAFSSSVSLSNEDASHYHGEGDLSSGSLDSLPEAGEFEDDERCLFIGDLARGLNEDQLREAFEPFGVISVEIKRDRVTNYSLGYGFVLLKSREDAGAAKKAMHRQVVGGRAIRIGWAQKNTNLFIGDLDPTITSAQLREVFRQFGPIYEEETFVKNRNYGFVRFRHRKHAELAKREMNNKVLGARAIRIGWGDANYQRHCVHIQFEPAESEALTESEVISKFEEFGTVMSVNLPRNQGQLRGFGFIYYDDTDAGENSAARAITTLNSAPICGVRIQCNYGKKPSNKKKKQNQKITGGRPPRGGMQGMGAGGGRGGRQQALFPVQVMMPVGPQGAWQPVQYMMTAQQAHQFYNSLQYSPGPHAGAVSPQIREASPQQEMQHMIQPAQGPDGRQYWPQAWGGM